MHKEPIYSPSQVAISGFLAGPAASIFFIKNNFRVLGDAVAEKKAMLYGSIALLFLLAILPFLPDRFPNILIPTITLISTRSIVESYQLKKKQIEESDKYTFQSNWRVFWLSLLFLVLFVVLFVVYVFALMRLGFISDA